MTPQGDEWQSLLKRLEALEKLTMELLNRVHRLERQMGVKPMEAPPPQIPPPPKIPPPVEIPPPAEPRPTVAPPKPTEPLQVVQPTPSPQLTQPSELPQPTQPTQPTQPSQPLIDWETLIGGKWALWIGVVLLLFAAAFFMNLIWAAIGPQGRVLIGVSAGLAFLVGGEYAKGRTAKWFSEGITAGGLALLYLTIWAAARRYQLVDIPTAFAAMAVVTATGVALSVRYDALSLILLSTIGGYMTPVLLRGNGAGVSPTLFFFGYVTVLNAGILATAAYKQWRVMNFVTFITAMLLISGWWLSGYTPDLRWHTFVFLTVNFLIFVGIGSVYPLRFRVVGATEDLAFFIGVAVVYFLPAAYLLSEPLARVQGAFPLALAAFYWALGEITRQRFPEDKGLMLSNYGLAVAFLTIAIPMQFRGNPMAIAWTAEAAVLTTVAMRVKSSELRDAATVVWLLAIMTVAWLDIMQPITIANWRPLFNSRFVTFATIIAATAYMAYEHWRNAMKPDELPMPNGFAFVSGAFVFWLIGREVITMFEWGDWFEPHQTVAAWLTVFSLWALVAAGLFILSLSTRLVALQILATIAFLGIVFMIVFWGWEIPKDWLPLFNLRLLAVLLIVGGLATSVAVARQQPAKTEWAPVPLFAVVASVLTTLALSQEVYAAFARWRFPSPNEWNTAAWFALTALWGLAGLTFFALGLRWNMSELRWMGILA